jgi:hypothetical protein
VDLNWSTIGAEDCLRVAGLVGGAVVRVHPAGAAKVGTAPSMAGRLIRDGDDVCFVPRYAFVEGTAYAVEVDGRAVAELVRAGSPRRASTEVAAIYPSAATVPRNLLRCYVWFTAAMSEGYAASQVRLLDDAGEVMAGALLPTEHELWDPRRRRLTVLLDPARIKRGLAPHREAGYPLRSGSSFRLTVDAGFRDAAGNPLRVGADRRYRVDGDERRRVEPHRWVVTAPPSGTDVALRVAFDRPLDHGLLARCLRVVAPDGRPVRGTVEIGPGERTWQLTPDRAWSAGHHEIVVAPILEDIAGNSVRRVFDRDLTRDDREPEQVRLGFAPCLTPDPPDA